MPTFTAAEAAALLEYDVAMLERLLTAGKAHRSLTATVHTAVTELADPAGTLLQFEFESSLSLDRNTV